MPPTTILRSSAPRPAISLRMFMSSTGSLTQFLTTMHSKPSVEPGSNGGATYSASYTTGGSAAAVVSSSATIVSTDSPTLASMTVTLDNPQDGSSEQLLGRHHGYVADLELCQRRVDGLRRGRPVNLRDGSPVGDL